MAGEGRRGKRFRMTLLALLLLAPVLSGCVTRQIAIITDPAGADVIINDRFIGKSPVVVETKDYGNLDLAVEKEGHVPRWMTLQHPRPWWGYDPLLLLLEVAPFPIRDEKIVRLRLEKHTDTDVKSLQQRAEAAHLSLK